MEKQKKLWKLAEGITENEFYALINYCQENTDGPLRDGVIKAIVQSGNAEYNFRFAYSVIGADIPEHGKAVITSGDAKYNYEFAKYIKGADVPAHAEVVIKSGDAQYNYLFAKKIPGADIRAHGEVVIESGNSEYNARFAQIDGSDTKAHIMLAVKCTRCNELPVIAKDVPEVASIVQNYRVKRILDRVKGIKEKGA